MKILDIETVPLPNIMETWYPEWATKKFPEMSPEEIEHQAGLYPEFGMICAIGISDPNGNPTSATAKNLDDEKEILLQLDDILAMKETLVGHNLKGFDLPFLAKRYMYHGLHVPNTLRVSNMKPWEIPHIDTMEKMRFGGGMSMSLRSACFLLGIGDPKLACSGGDVWDLFKKGNFEQIANYVESDVKFTDKLYQKILTLSP